MSHMPHHQVQQSRCQHTTGSLFSSSAYKVYIVPRHSHTWRTRNAGAQVLAAAADVESQLTAHFDLLAGVLAPGNTLKADYTPLGRGLVATQPIPAQTPMLAVDWANMMCVTDMPNGKAGNAFGKRVLQDWQLLHKKMPPLLVSYLMGSSGKPLRQQRC
jgi:hypothetical protein